MREAFESLIVFGIMAGILLPARIIFVEFVSDIWFGSVGVITAISVLVIILAKKKKLGFFGHMLERQMYKFQKGKRAMFVFGESVFLLSLLGLMIFSIDYGYSANAEIQNTVISNENSVSEILETNEMSESDWVFGFLMAPVMLLTEFPEMSMTIAAIDKKLDGWLMHFYTVGFVEYLELLGILIYYKISFKKKSLSLASVYSKAAV